MIIDKYDAKETLEYRWRKSYMSTARREEKQREIGEEIYLQANYWSPPPNKDEGWAHEKAEQRNKKRQNIQRQETEETTGREKVGEGAIRKKRTQDEIATKVEQRNMIEKEI